MTSDKLNEEKAKKISLQKLKVIGDSGSCRVSKAMEQLLNVPIKMHNIAINVYPLGTLLDMLRERYGENYSISQHLFGEVPGGFCLMCSREKALKIADLLLGRPLGETTQLDILVESALYELTNVVVGSFLTSLTKGSDVAFMPSLPNEGPPEPLMTIFEKMADYSEAVLVEILMEVENPRIETLLLFIADAHSLSRVISSVMDDIV